MLKKVFIFIVFLVTASLAWWGFDRINWSDRLDVLVEMGELINPVQVEDRVTAPPPLTLDNLQAPAVNALDPDKIWEIGNEKRMAEGLTPLARSNLLDEAAQLKVEDMFQRQYFAHDSPDGQGIDVLAGQVGYNFVLIGENLALGNFRSEESLIQGWMDSPGHRENILHQQYQEIGLATKLDTFEGRIVWLAVQVFALPVSACPAPDEELRLSIDQNKNLLEEKYLQIEEIKEALGNIRPRRGDDYFELVDAYNLLVQDYNELAQETSTIISDYNNQVAGFNECLGH